MTLGRLAALTIAIGLWSLVPSSAMAQDRLARTHYQAGSSYYEQGRYEDALREFEEALRLSSAPRRPALLFNIGQTHERLGHMQDAITTFRQYLEAAPDADDADVVRERIRSLQERFDSTAVSLQVTEQGAHVLIDGEDRGTTPLEGPIRVTPGAHEVRVEKEGFQSFSVRVTVPAGESVSVEANLVSTSPATAPPQRGGVPSRPEEPPPETSSGPGVLPWVFIGVGGVAMVGGGLFGLAALGARNEANDAATGDRQTYDDARARAKGSALLADVGFGVAVVSAAIGVVLLVTGGSDSHQEAAADVPAVAPVLVDGGAGIALAGHL